MAKKKKCRWAEDEKKIHKKAVKIRKMTDEQLADYITDRVEKARSEGFNQGKQKTVQSKADTDSIIEEIKKIKGIGETKLKEIRTILESRLGKGGNQNED